MTKYEWEKELKRNLAKLPADEVNRALSFYDELFADKAEQGYSEREVINEFGNPFDVANSIIRDYEAENGTAKDAAPPKDDRKKQREPEPRAQNIPPRYNYGDGVQHAPYGGDPHNNAYYGGDPYNNAHYGGYTERDMRRARQGGAVGTIMRILFFIPYFVLLIVSASLIFSFAAAAVGCVAGGIVYVFSAFTLIPSGGGVAMANFGIGFAAIAVGALFAISVPHLYKAAKSLTKVYFGVRDRRFGNYREGN